MTLTKQLCDATSAVGQIFLYKAVAVNLYSIGYRDAVSKLMLMQKEATYFINRLKEKLWVRPLLFCIVSVGVAFLAHYADSLSIEKVVPELERNSIKELLTTMSASMLVIAIFAVGSMVSAYNAASSSATPRSFSLIIADDVSQNALSVYVGSFIYSIVSTVALQNAYFGKTGKFVLLVITLLMFALVIVTFLRWVQRIAKLGRVGNTIEKIEAATAGAIISYRKDRYGGGVPIIGEANYGVQVLSGNIGYIQLINTKKLQDIADDLDVTIVVQHLPGRFVSTADALVQVRGLKNNLEEDQIHKIHKAFTIGCSRYFGDDPRFGLIALTEVASRALSPAINDPGTAIAVLSSHVRLFALYYNKINDEQKSEPRYRRVQMPLLNEGDFFVDAFRPIARDGAGTIEVMIRLQKTLATIAEMGDGTCKELVKSHAQQAYKRAKASLSFSGDIDALNKIYQF